MKGKKEIDKNTAYVWNFRKYFCYNGFDSSKIEECLEVNN